MKSLLLLVAVLSSSVVFAQRKSEIAENLYRQALDLYRKRDLEPALDACEQSLEYSITAKTYYLNGLIFEAMKRDLRAVSAYEAALKIDPTYDEALFQKGIIYLNYGDPSQAAKDFSLLLDRNSIQETRTIYFELGANGEKVTSIATLKNLESKVYYNRGQAYTKMEDYDRAEQDFNQAINLDSMPDYFVGRGLMFRSSKQLILAENDFKQAIFLDSLNQLAWYNLALLNPSTDLPDELLVDNSFAPTLGLLASQALVEEDYPAAERYLSQAIVHHAEPLHYINRGRARVKLSNYDLARADFNEARKMDPSRFECLHLIGNTYFYQKEHELAVSFYNQYLTLDPQNAMVWFNAAMSYLQLNEEMDACHYLNRANNLGMVQAKEMIDKLCR